MSFPIRSRAMTKYEDLIVQLRRLMEVTNSAGKKMEEGFKFFSKGEFERADEIFGEALSVIREYKNSCIVEHFEDFSII